MTRTMWRRIEIRNFRSIEYADAYLAPLTLVVGPNGSGKSNFADAFVFVRDVASDASAAVPRRGGILGVRRWNRTRPFDVTIDLRVARTKEELASEYAQHRFTLGSGAEGKWHFKRETVEADSAHHKVSFHIEREGAKFTALPNEWPVRPSLEETTSAMLYARQVMHRPLLLALQSVKRYRLNSDAMRQPQVVSDMARLDESGANICAAVRRLANTKDFEVVKSAMRRIVPGLENIRVVEVGRYLLLEFHQRQGSGDVAPFQATEISEGALRALGIIVAARQMRPNELLIIEEPEVNIHAGAASLLFDILKQASRRGAVLLTTHSPELLDAARDEEILVCAYRDGLTHVGPLASEQRQLVRDGLFSVADLMRSDDLRMEGEPPAAIPPEP